MDIKLRSDTHIPETITIIQKKVFNKTNVRFCFVSDITKTSKYIFIFSLIFTIFKCNLTGTLYVLIAIPWIHLHGKLKAACACLHVWPCLEKHEVYIFAVDSTSIVLHGVERNSSWRGVSDLQILKRINSLICHWFFCAASKNTFVLLWAISVSCQNKIQPQMPSKPHSYE